METTEEKHTKATESTKKTEKTEKTETTETTNVPKEKLAPYLSEKPKKEFLHEAIQPATQSVGMDILGTISIYLFYFISVIFSVIGFYKLWVYESPEDSIYGSSMGVNAVVGGDAYNFMINATTAVAYFLVALIFVVIASSLLIAKSIRDNK
jgi:hypothetical protein